MISWLQHHIQYVKCVYGVKYRVCVSGREQQWILESNGNLHAEFADNKLCLAVYSKHPCKMHAMCCVGVLTGRTCLC